MLDQNLYLWIIIDQMHYYPYFVFICLSYVTEYLYD